MKAIAYKKPYPSHHPEVFSLIDLPQPVASGRDLLIAVKAISVNPVDIKMRLRTAIENEQWRVLGHDAVGVVVAVGDQVENFKVGDTVFYAGSNLRSGSYAEYQLVDEQIVGLKPKSLSNPEAAALPLTSLTAWEMLFHRLNVQQPIVGQSSSILIIGAAGGVGSIAVQLLKAMTDLVVIATASRPESTAWLEQIGADFIIDHTQPLAEQLLALDLAPPAFVFSITGTADYRTAIESLIAAQGRFGLIDDPEHFTINGFKSKSVSIHWESMFTRSTFQTPDLSRQGDILNSIAALIDQGKIKSTIAQHLGHINVENISKAHAFIETGRSIGKIVLEGF